jgi:hypothetical protein
VKRWQKTATLGAVFGTSFTAVELRRNGRENHSYSAYTPMPTLIIHKVDYITKEEGTDVPRYLNIQRHQCLETSPSVQVRK